MTRPVGDQGPQGDIASGTRRRQGAIDRGRRRQGWGGSGPQGRRRQGQKPGVHRRPASEVLSPGFDLNARWSDLHRGWGHLGMGIPRMQNLGASIARTVRNQPNGTWACGDPPQGGGATLGKANIYERIVGWRSRAE